MRRWTRWNTGGSSCAGTPARTWCSVVAANRIGVETTDGVTMSFYGSSIFIADHLGALQAEADRATEQVLVRAFDLEQCRDYRQSWGCFRDRRPDLYGALCTLDGQLRATGAAP